MDETTGLGAFSPLFNINVPHILEEIFFLLDYDSIMACCRVCNKWNQLLSNETYEKRINKKRLKKRIREIMLIKSARKGNLKKVNDLLSNGVNKDYIGAAGTPMYNAAHHGCTEVVKLLIDRGADPNLIGPSKNQVLISLIILIVLMMPFKI